MAEIVPHEASVNPSNTRGSYLSASYAEMQNGDVGLPTEGDTATASGASVQVGGVFGGASVVIEGTNDGANWLLLHDLKGITLALGGPDLKGVQESVMQIRPRITGGDDTTSVNVAFMFRRS